MSQGYFITGTDTGCGKTEISCGLMRLLQRQGHSVLGMKPIASGAESGPDGLRNEDALKIQAHNSVALPYEQVNLYCFLPPIAPHLAAQEVEETIHFSSIKSQLERLSQQAERLIVEGVGGWRVPLGPDGDIADLAVALELPVILVVGIKLGCINHALLTVESIRSKGIKLAGWVANQVDGEMARLAENIGTLQTEINAPCLGLVPFMRDPDADRVADFLSIDDKAV